MNDELESKPDSGKSNGEFKGTVTLKYKEENRTYDLSNPEHRQQLTDLAQKGYGADQVWSERAELRRVVDNWNKRLELAQTDEGAWELLKSDIEKYTGRKLTAKEQKAIQSEEVESFEDPRLAKIIKSLEDTTKQVSEKIQQIESRIEKKDVDSLAKDIETANEKLSKKWSATKDSPKYDKKAVLDFAGSHNLLLSGDIEEGLELAYKMMNFDALTTKAQKQTAEQIRDSQQKLKDMHVEGDGEPGKLDTEKKSFKNYSEITKYLQDRVDENKLFTND